MKILAVSDKEDAKLVRTWLVSNASNFGALLNDKDINSYKNLINVSISLPPFCFVSTLTL